MTEERLNEITAMAGYLLNEICVWFKQDESDKGWTIALDRNTDYFFYIAAYEFKYDNFYLSCNIADVIRDYTILGF